MGNKVAFTGLAEQAVRLRAEIDANIGRVLDHGQFIMGPEVREFEQKLQAFCGARHAIAVANGTDALQIALMAYGIGAGDAVLVPSFTYTATAEVILVLGAVPVFVEVDPETFNIDIADLKVRIATARAQGKSPKAIIAVDLFGLPADWATLNTVANDEGLVLIADAAQSFGAVMSGDGKVGTLAPVTTTSFFPAKPLGCYGDGGAIFTNDDELAKVLRQIARHGQDRRYHHIRVGVNSRLDTLQAAILLPKLALLDQEIQQRQQVAERYTQLLNQAGINTTPHVAAGNTSAWAQYTVQVAQREQVQTKLQAAGIPTAVHYPIPLNKQPAVADATAQLPVGDAVAQRVMSLPMHPYLSAADQERIVQAVQTTLEAL